MVQPVSATEGAPLSDSKAPPMASTAPAGSRPSSRESAQQVIKEDLSRHSMRRSSEGIPLDIDLKKPGTGHAYSPFYQHPDAPSLADQRPTPSAGFEKDVEKGLLTPLPAAHLQNSSTRSSFEPSPSFRTETNVMQTPKTASTSSFFTPIKQISTGRTSYGGKDRDAISVTVWPTCSEMRQRKKDARRMKSCLLFRALSRKQKIAAKICLAILIVGFAVIIGCVISYKTGGLVWKSSNNYGAIGS